MNRVRGARVRVGGLALLVLVLGGCSGALNLPARHRPQTYLVHRGDTLYSIAWHYGLDYHTVAHWNRIPPPYTIYPGQRISLYAGGAGASAAPARATAKTRTAPSSAAPKQPAVPAKAVAGAGSGAPPAGAASAAPPQWQWPASGTVVSTFGKGKDLASQGIMIEGHLGEPVLAAAGGTVVYVGDALVGYGRLVIVKHNEEWLSAYAHNQRLLVHEGEEVHAGQKIATMGMRPDGKAALYFEIRNNGDPVDPLRFLPKTR